MKEKKRIWRFFGVWNSDKEERWLEDQADSGWVLESVGFLNYTFRKEEPCKMSYQFDFSTHKKEDQSEYLAIYEASGWKHLGTVGSWYYFSKPKREGEPQKIYSDTKSLSDMYKRLIAFLLIINFPTLYFLLVTRTSMTVEMPAAITNGLVIVMSIVEVLIIYAIVRIVLRIKRLNEE